MNALNRVSDSGGGVRHFDFVEERDGGGRRVGGLIEFSEFVGGVGVTTCTDSLTNQLLIGFGDLI